MYEGADDDGRNVAPSRAITREQALANIVAMKKRAELARSKEIDAAICGASKHPDAPHPDPRWRARSRIVFQKMAAELWLHVAPWHHHEIWIWAASTAAGCEWIEREVTYWENRCAREEARRRALLESLRLKLLGEEPIDDDDAYE